MRSCLSAGVAFLVLTVFISAQSSAAPAPGQMRAGTGQQASGLEIRSRLGGELTAVYRISVKSYADADRDLAGYRTFAFEYRSKAEPLLEKELSRQLQTVMETRGLTRQDESPQMVVHLDFTVQPAPNDQYLRYLQVNFLDAAQLRSGKELTVPPVIWRGEAASVGTQSDIRIAAPFMFREAMGEFPATSGRGAERNIYCQPFGYTGIAVDRRDWHVITAVRPGSPAAAAGVTVTDSIEKIDDAAVSWRMTYRPDQEKYPFKRANYVEDDYLYIRWTSRTGSTMTLRLKSPDGKARTVKVLLQTVDPCDLPGAPR